MSEANPVQRRSSEELAMRDHVEAWGRARWPDARVFHELVVGECRVDVAFIRPNDLIGVEIKSSKDVLSRLEKQHRVFSEHLPELWFAIAPKWKDHPDKPYLSNEIVVTESGVEPQRWYLGHPNRNRLVYDAMLRLIWADEARAIAGRKGLLANKRQPLRSVLPELALHLTGAEILAEVCRELRGRYTASKSDAPIRYAAEPLAVVPNLFRAPPPHQGSGR